MNHFFQSTSLLLILLSAISGCSASIGSKHEYSDFDAVMNSLQSIAKSQSTDLVQIKIEERKSEPASSSERLIVIDKTETSPSNSQPTETHFTIHLAKPNDHWVCTSVKTETSGSKGRSESTMQGKGMEIENLIKILRL